MSMHVSLFKWKLSFTFVICNKYLIIYEYKYAKSAMRHSSYIKCICVWNRLEWNKYVVEVRGFKRNDVVNILKHHIIHKTPKLKLANKLNIWMKLFRYWLGPLQCVLCFALC